jgi:hypothetical protein
MGNRAKDLTGLRFGRLVVVRRDGSKSRAPAWICRCDCGQDVCITSGNLSRQKSCGCLRREKTKQISKVRPLHDLTGHRFGRLTVISPSAQTDRNRRWNCICDCGSERSVFARSLLFGVSTSCGCLMRENASKRFRKHGLSGTAEYRSIYHNNRRARKRALPFEDVNPIDVLNAGGWHCYLCGCSTPRSLRGTRARNAPQVDHVIPLARGGHHVRSNLACICLACNQRKSSRLLCEIGAA